MNCVDTLPNSNDGGRRATDGRALRTVVLGHGLAAGGAVVVGIEPLLQAFAALQGGLPRHSVHEACR